jgi:hypothetical protein
VLLEIVQKFIQKCIQTVVKLRMEAASKPNAVRDKPQRFTFILNLERYLYSFVVKALFLFNSLLIAFIYSSIALKSFKESI